MSICRGWGTDRLSVNIGSYEANEWFKHRSFGKDSSKSWVGPVDQIIEDSDKSLTTCEDDSGLGI